MDKQKRQDVIIKICCVIAALVLWTYIRVSENPVITSTVKYVPVQILNEDTLEQRSLVIIPNQDFYINLSVKATATTLADLDKNKDFKLVADLNGYALTPGENKIKVTLKEAPAGVSVVNADGLLMKIDVDNFISKEMPIEANVTGKVKEGYYNDENILTPSTATISGPERYVSQVARVIADIDVSKEESDISKNYQLKCVDASDNEITGVTINPEHAQITSKVSKGKHLTINPVTKGNLGSSLILQGMEVSPKTIEISGAQTEIDKYSTIDTEPIDLSSITGDTTLEVKLKVPENLSLVQKDATVKVKISTKKIIEKTFKVPLEYINLKDGYTLVKKVNEIEVTISGDSKIIETIDTGVFKATANLSQIGEGTHPVAVELAGVPNNVEVKNKKPSSVDVEIKLTNEENGTNGA